MQEIVNDYTQNENSKQFAVQNVCCVTHACSRELIAEGVNNLMRTVNKMTVSAYFKELNMFTCDPKLDPLHHFDTSDSRVKLNAIMPILNSVHLWGRYK